MHAGRPPRDVDQPLNAPITMASTYVAGGDLEYGRYEPDVVGVRGGARRPGVVARWPSPRLAAVSTVLDLVGQDALVVAPRHAYLGSIGLLGDLEARGRVTACSSTSPTPPRSSAPWTTRPSSGSSRRPTPPSRSPTSRPSCGPADAGAVVVDNTFATPLVQRPLEPGADIVLHSVTKFLAGHSDVVMGALGSATLQLYDVLKGRRDLVGAIPGTLEAWFALRGLRTLHLRVERSQATAIELARRLESHPAIESVRYPGFGAIVAAVLPTAEAATCSRTRRRCGCTPPRSAASSRRSNAAGAGRARPRPSPRASSGCPSASRTSTTSGAGLEPALARLS